MNALLLAVAIVAHETGYYTSLATHMERWLNNEGVKAQTVQVGAMANALKNEKLAFLVGFDRPTAGEIATLKAFQARGGKLVVFYSSSPELARMMGVKPLGYRMAGYAGEWSRMDFSANCLKGVPSSILQTSTVLQRIMPLSGKGRVIATWSDRAGKHSGEAAWVASAGGYWMSHVLLADGEEDKKAQLLGAIVGSIDERLWSYEAHVKRKEERHRALREYALSQVPVKGEIHAVWDHSGCGLYPGNWQKTMHVLREARVTDLFVNVAGAGFAHYSSEVLPRSKIFMQEGDQLKAALEAASGTGIRVHAWMLTFSATRATPDRLNEFAKRGWRLKFRNGTLSEYLDPANKDVRLYMLKAIEEIQTRYPVAGVHLDFVRYGDGVIKPANASTYVSSFVAEARRRVKRPKWLTTAVYGKYPACIGSVGQDWDGWLKMNLVDYVVPMDYTANESVFAELLAQHASLTTHARKTIVGIGVTANESRLDAKGVINQIRLTRKYGLAGNALFDLDITLERQIFPYLKLGIW